MKQERFWNPLINLTLWAFILFALRKWLLKFILTYEPVDEILINKVTIHFVCLEKQKRLVKFNLTFESVDEVQLSDHSFCLPWREEIIDQINSKFWSKWWNPIKWLFLTEEQKGFIHFRVALKWNPNGKQVRRRPMQSLRRTRLADLKTKMAISYGGNAKGKQETRWKTFVLDLRSS